MNVITVCVPSARVSSHVNRAFRRYGFSAKALEAPPPTDKHHLVVEHLPRPIEPAKKQQLWVVVPAGMAITDFLERSFLDEGFMRSLVGKLSDPDDLMALECIVAACSARTVRSAYTGPGATELLYKAARIEGTNPTRCRLAEQVLGIPSLLELLMEFAEYQIAEADFAARQVCA